MRWERWAAATGIGFVALFVVGFLLPGDQPGVADPDAEIVAFLGDNRRNILIGAMLIGLSTMFLAWFVGALVHALREAGQDRLAATALGGGMIATALMATISAVYAALAYSVAETTTPATTAALYDVVWAIGVMASFPVAVLIGATALASLRSGLMPIWFAWTSVAATAVMIAAGTTWARDGFWSPTGAFSLISIVVMLGWTVVASGLLVAHRAPAAAPTATTPIGAH